jgi:hypothetical protein
MANPKAGATSGNLLPPNLPTPEESAAAVRQAVRRLGLLIDLHRVAERLRDLDAKTARSST